MNIILKNIINIFTIKDGKINLITKNKKLIEFEFIDDLDTSINKYIKKNINIKGLDLKQCHAFSKKSNNNLEISILYIDIVNINNINLDNDFILLEVKELNDNIYVKESMEYLKKQLILNSTIKKLYPGEFVLPEIQKIYEDLLNKKYDRRNFRKKLIKLDVIEDLNKISSNKNGRPAKLYKFKDIKEDKVLF